MWGFSKAWQEDCAVSTVFMFVALCLIWGNVISIFKEGTAKWHFTTEQGISWQLTFEFITIENLGNLTQNYNCYKFY